MTGKSRFFQTFYYGWFIVFIGGLGIFFSGPGQTYSNSAFIDEYIHDFGWSRTEVSSLYSGATLIAGLTLMFVGRFIDKYGQRFMMVTVGIVFALACFFNSMVTNMLMLGIGFFLVRNILSVFSNVHHVFSIPFVSAANAFSAILTSFFGISISFSSLASPISTGDPNVVGTEILVQCFNNRRAGNGQL